MTISLTSSPRNMTLCMRALQCELYKWRVHRLGRLAEIIVLDQFSRNIYRGTARAFAADPLALALAQEAIATKAAAALAPRHRAFLYMPYISSVRQFSEQIQLTT